MPRKPREKKPPAPPPPRVGARQVTVPLIVETGDGREDGYIWLSRIAKTTQLRDGMPNGAQDWQRYWKFFENEMWLDSQNSQSLYTDSSRETATVNTVGSICLSYQPYLVNGDIKFKLKARKPSEVTSAIIQEALLNYEWQERTCTAEVKK